MPATETVSVKTLPCAVVPSPYCIIHVSPVSRFEVVEAAGSYAGRFPSWLLDMDEEKVHLILVVSPYACSPTTPSCEMLTDRQSPCPRPS